MRATDFNRALLGYGFKPSSTDASSIELPFSFKLEPGKSIGAWVVNNASALQNLFINEAGNQRISFNSSNVYVKTNTGSVYSVSKATGTNNNPAFLLFTVTASRELKLFFGIQGVITESNIATLAEGEFVEFTNKIVLGKSGDSANYMNCIGDDLSFWNCTLDLNKAEVLYNRGEGVNCHLLPFAVPAATGLAYYIPLDNINLINRTTNDKITGTSCSLTSPKLNYFVPNALYFYDTSDYAVSNQGVDWDIAEINTYNHLIFTFVFRSNIGYSVAEKNKYAALLSLGSLNESDSFVIYVGNTGSSTEYLTTALDQLTGTYRGIAWIPSGGQQTQIPASSFNILSYVITGAGTSIVFNGVNVAENFTASASIMPFLSHNFTNLRLGKLPWTLNGEYYGFMREVSIINKALSVDNVINLHRNYLALGQEDPISNANTSILETNAFDLLENAGLTQNDVFAYWKGNRINGSGLDDVKGIILEDSSGNNRHLNLQNYVFPEFPLIQRNGKIFL